MLSVPLALALRRKTQRAAPLLLPQLPLNMHTGKVKHCTCSSSFTFDSKSNPNPTGVLYYCSFVVRVGDHRSVVFKANPTILLAKLKEEQDINQTPTPGSSTKFNIIQYNSRQPLRAPRYSAKSGRSLSISAVVELSLKHMHR